MAGAAQTPECHIPLASEGCYGLRPADLHAAYGLPQAAVSTQTLAIVTAGGDPTIKKDLANYDSEFGLPGCPGETPCPMIVNGQGKKHLPAVEGDAPLETSLDVEVAHAVCPGCALLLVEASSASLAAFEEATDTAAELGAGEISISWGEAEPAQVREGGAAFDHPGVVVTAAAGDTGYLNWASPEAERGRPEYPASSPDVIAVGGTDLELGPAGQWQGEQVWDQLEPGDEAGGSGCSALFAAPSWQLELPDWESVGCGGLRATADIAAIADPLLGVAVYDSTKDTEGEKPGGADSAGPASVPRWSPRRSRSPEGLMASPTRRRRFTGTRRAIPGCCTTSCRGRTAPAYAPWDADAASKNRRQIAFHARSASRAPATTGRPAWGAWRGSGRWSCRSFRTLPPSPARRGGSFAVEAVVEATGQPVSVISTTPAVCTADAGEVTLLAAGTCTLVAAQAGYLEAQQSFTVARTRAAGRLHLDRTDRRRRRGFRLRAGGVGQLGAAGHVRLVTPRRYAGSRETKSPRCPPASARSPPAGRRCRIRTRGVRGPVLHRGGGSVGGSTPEVKSAGWRWASGGSPLFAGRHAPRSRAPPRSVSGAPHGYAARRGDHACRSPPPRAER